MATKDSFTFSDKLKKSKSLPLSKRIPSRSGGDGKAKRTLIQRAQRDLPFIIVAALALLLLPLLSRNSGSDYVTGWDNPGYDEFVGDGDHGLGYISGDGDLMPASGYRNPLDMIVTKKGEDSPAPIADDYSDDDISSMTRSQDSFDREETSKPVTSAYRTNARRSVRNAVQRKETAKGELRNRAMSFGGNGSGLTRNLAIGGAPIKAASVGAPRQGVRPVALQPLKSYGVGRNSEGIYAEMARSLGAMNQGPSKQALYEAQLRDVDGTPLGAATDPRAAAARLASQGSVPDHKFGYTNQKPWWWDMMADRSQKLWELWNYNWQKALSDSLIKIATNLGMCLITGSEDGSVKNFLGIRAGDDEDICVSKEDGKTRVLAQSLQAYIGANKGDGKDGNNATTGAGSEWKELCEAAGGKSIVDPNGRKDPIQARARCLGGEGRFGALSKTNYSANCDGVSNKNLVYTVSATANKGGKQRPRKENNLGIYVLAQSKADKDVPFVIIFAQGTGNSLSLSESDVDNISKNCQITHVGSFRAKRTLESGLRSKVTGAYNFCVGASNKKPENKELVHRADLFEEYNRWNEKANSKDQWNGSFESENGKKGAAKNKKDIKGSDVGVNECVVKNSDVVFEKLGGDNNGNYFSCDKNVLKKNLLAAPTTFSATISGVGKDSVYAIVVENGKQDGTDGVFIRTIAAVNAEYNKSMIDKSGDTYTIHSMQIGRNSIESSGNARPGHGRVYWVVTSSKKAKERKAANNFIKGAYVDHTSVSDFLEINGGYRMETCDYSWNCTAESCRVDEDDGVRRPDPPADNGDGLCYLTDKNGNAAKDNQGHYQLFRARNQNGVYIQNSINTVKDEEIRTIYTDIGAGDCIDCKIEAKIKANEIHPCAPICKKLAKALGQDAFNIHEQDNAGNGKEPELVPWNAINDPANSFASLKDVGNNNTYCPYCNDSDQPLTRGLVGVPPQIEEKCNFASHVNFQNAQFDPGYTATSRNTGKTDAMYSSMVNAFKECFTTLSGANVSETTLYITGFTNYAGDDDNDPKHKKCFDVKTGKSLPKGSCNQALSEDRAIYSAHYLFKKIQEWPGNFSIELQPDTTNNLGFNNTKQPSVESATRRYSHRNDNKTVTLGNGQSKITIKVKGCGSAGHSANREDPNDRVMFFTTEDIGCNRPSTNGNGDIAYIHTGSRLSSNRT